MHLGCTTNSTKCIIVSQALTKWFPIGDKVLYFLKAVDAKDRRELGSLLEDETQPNGLITDWVVVKRAYDQFDKCRR